MSLAMRLSGILYLAALMHSTFSDASAPILGSNSPVRHGVVKSLIVSDPSDTAISNLPTVPSFSGPTFTYGAFSDVYPSGYTLPTPFPTVPSAVSGSASASFSTTVDFLEHDQYTKYSYLRSMCFPRATGGAKTDTHKSRPDLKFPCNRIQNTTYTCVFNATYRVVDQNGAKLNEVSPKAQQECFCSGGRGNRVWEEFSGCSECLRLHGARPDSSNDDDNIPFLPPGFMEDLSSAYCAQKTALKRWADFRDKFSITHPLSYGTGTGVPDLLESRTDIGDYFTETSSSASSSAKATSTTIDRKPSGVSAKTPNVTQPQTSLRQSASGSVSAAANFTGSANSLKSSAAIGIAESRPPPAQAHTFIFEPCFLWGVRPLQLVTTSPNKKRRLSPPEDSDPQNSSAGTISNAQGLSSPPQLSLPDQHLQTSSPPRYIPPHLTVQGIRQARSPTPELSTAASSPSAAYAGLTLDSEGTEDASGTENVKLNGRGGSFNSQEIKLRGSLSNRSSSPVTKRPAADMDGSMDGANDERSEKDVSFSEPKMNGSQHKRVASVDMIKNEHNGIDLIKKEPDDSQDQASLSDVPQARATPPSHRDSQSTGSSSPATLRATLSPGATTGAHPSSTLKSDPFPVKVEDHKFIKHEEATDPRFVTPSRVSPSSTSQSADTSPATFRTSSPQTLRGTLSPATFRGDSVPVKAEDFSSVKHEEAATSIAADTSQSSRLSSPATMTGDYGSVKKEDSNDMKEDVPILPRPVSYSGETLPSIDEQIETVEQILQTPLSEGEKGYLVSYKWLARVFSRSSHIDRASKYPKEAMEGEVGPVDNSGLNVVMDPMMKDLKDEKGQPYIPLCPGLRNREHFEIVPEQAWELIISWYGLSQGSEVMIRYCHNTTTNQALKNYEYELYPPIFTILKLPDQAEAETKRSVADRISRPVKALASRHETFQSFLARAKKAANINIRIKVRIWKIYGGLGDGNRSGAVSSATITPDPSRSTSPVPGTVPLADAGPSLVVDLAAFLDLEEGSQREIVDIKDETANDKYNGRSSLDLVGLCCDEVIVLEEQIQGPAGGEWASDAVQNRADTDPAKHAKLSAAFSKTNFKANSTSSGRTSPAPLTGVITRGRTQKMDRRRGTLGLVNLSNTCYMNSAIQCFRSVKELTPYFKNGHYKPDINMKNVLGHKGELVTAYANLLIALYGDHTKGAINPREFKHVVGKCNAMYSGLGQQDSQEFLGWLLGELDEELNRVKTKLYTPNPDSTDDMVNDPAAIRVLAKRCWAIYKTRYNSVITDLFAGLYKSTVACPQCNKVSITFDPFNTITVALAIKDVWIHDVYFFPRRGKPTLVSVDIDKTATMLAVKELMAKFFDADAKKMIVAEIHKNAFYKIFDDETPIGEQTIAQTDMIAVYELQKPVRPHWLRPQKKTEIDSDHDSPLYDEMLVAVFHRLPRGSSREPRGLWGVPSFITIAREDARDYDEVLMPALFNVDNLTTRTIDPDTNPLPREPPSNGIVDPKKPRRPSFSTQLVEDEFHEKFHMKVFATAEQIPLGVGFKVDESREYTNVVDRRRLAAAAANNSDDGPEETSTTKINRDPLIIYPFEAILLDWEGPRHDELFAGTKGDPNDKRGVPTYTKNNIQRHKDAKFDERQEERSKQKRDGITLADCLKEYGKPEVLSESNTWNCPRCEAPRRACKKLEIWKSPDIVVIHLKRFANSQTRRNKLDFRVDFPTEGLDLTEKILSMQKEDERAIYDLFGVVNHTGNLGGGHYYAYAKNYLNEQWYEYNDTSVKAMNSGNVVTRAAYLLFYRRRSSEPLGGPLLRSIQPGSREASRSGEGMRLDDSSRNGLSSAFPVAGAVHQAGDGGQTSDEDEGPQEAAGYSSTRLPSYGPTTIQYTPEDMLAPSVDALEDRTAKEIDMAIHNRPLKVTVDPELTVTHRSGRQPELYLGPLGPNKPGWSFDPEDATTDATAEDEFPRNPSFEIIPIGGGYNMKPDEMPRRDSYSSAGSMDAAPPSPMSDSNDITRQDVLDPPEDVYEERHKSRSSKKDDDPNVEPILVPDSENTHLVISEDPDYWLAKKNQAPGFKPSLDPLDPTGRFIDPRNPPSIFVKPRVKKTREEYYDEFGFPKEGSDNMRQARHEEIQVIPYDPSNPDWDMSDVPPHYEEDNH